MKSQRRLSGSFRRKSGSSGKKLSSLRKFPRAARPGSRLFFVTVVALMTQTLSGILSYQNMLALERKTVFPDSRCRYSFRLKGSGVLHAVNLVQGVLYGIRKCLFAVFGIQDLKLDNNCIFFTIWLCASVCLARLQHDIIATKPTFTIGSDSIASTKLYQESEDEAMVEALRLCLFGRLVPAVEKADGIHCDPVHIMIHLPQVSVQKRLYETVVGRGGFCKPSANDSLEHGEHFPVGETETVLLVAAFCVEPVFLRSQVATGQQQAPDGIFIILQLAEYNLLIDLRRKGVAFE